MSCNDLHLWFILPTPGKHNYLSDPPPTPLEFFFDPCIHVHEYYNIVHVTLIQISKWKPMSHIACYNKVSNQTKYKT